MADLDWPEGLFPYKTLFYLQPHIGGQESPITRSRKVYGLSAPRWIARLTFRAGHGYDRDVGMGPRANDAAFYAARLDALIAELQGGLHCIRFHDFRRPRPQSYLSGYYVAGVPPTVAFASAGATSIEVYRPHGSIGPSIGDYIGGDGRPHIVTKVTPGNSVSMMSVAPEAGIITVEFQPPLSAAIDDGTPLEMVKVSARFRLTSEDAGQNEGEVGQPVEYTLDFAEDLLPDTDSGWLPGPGGPGGPPMPEPM